MARSPSCSPDARPRRVRVPGKLHSGRRFSVQHAPPPLRQRRDGLVQVCPPAVGRLSCHRASLYRPLDLDLRCILRAHLARRDPPSCRRVPGRRRFETAVGRSSQRETATQQYTGALCSATCFLPPCPSPRPTPPLPQPDQRRVGRGPPRRRCADPRQDVAVHPDQFVPAAVTGDDELAGCAHLREGGFWFQETRGVLAFCLGTP
ncbi:hypothetical protein VTO42DRAFT_773 [Malbranchea cinnamomea]